MQANQGAAGGEGQSIAEGAEDVENNRYTRWNRLASGRYVPPPVRRVASPTGEGRGRSL